MMTRRQTGSLLAFMAIFQVGLFGADASSVTFDKAVESYNANKFEQCYKEFNELFGAKPDDTRINFYLGRCAMEMKQYDEAQLAFERVLMVEPDHVRSKLELGRMYFEQKQFEEALSQFDEVMESNAPDAVKAQVKQFIAVIEDSKKKHHVSGAFIVGLTLDTNVKNDVGAVSYLTPLIGNANGNKSVYDYSMSETLAANHTYKINRSNWNWANSLVIYNQHYREAVDSNVLFTQIGSGMAYNSAAFNFSVTPTIENLKYGLTHSPAGAGGFEAIATTVSKILTIDRLVDTMSAYGVGEKFSMPIAKDYLLDQSLTLKRQYFKKHNGKNATGNLDATAVDFSVGIKKDLSEGKSLTGSIVLNKNIKTDGATMGPNVDFYARTLKIEYAMPVAKYFDLSVNAAVKKQDYGDPDTVQYGYERSDTVKTLGFTATKVIDPTTIVNMSFGRTYSDSNYGASVYQKNTLGFSFIKAF